MKRRLLIKTFTFLLALIMALLSVPLNAIADSIEFPKESEVYIKDVILSQNAYEAAKKDIENAGYIFFDKDLNAGTGNDSVYLGYTTTTDPSEAIYDMKLMNMNGGFTLTSMEKALESQKTALSKMAADLMMLIDEYVDAYYADVVAAKKVYKSLNFFRMEEEEPGEESEANGLGYRIVKGSIDIGELTEIILFCDTELVDCIVQLLTTGIQGRNSNWLQGLSKRGPYDPNAIYCEEGEEDELQRRAEELLPILQFYAQAYNAMAAKGIVSGNFNESMEIEGANYQPGYDITAEDADAKNLDMSRYQIYKIAFDELATYAYGEGTLKDFFCSLEDTSNEKLLYPMLSVLSDGEFAALSYGCVLDVILGAGINETAFENYDEVYQEFTQDATSIYLYGGVDQILFEEDTVIAFTDEANRHMAATGDMEFYETKSQAEESWETAKLVVKGITCAGLCLMALAKLVIVGTMIGTWTFKTATLIALKSTAGAVAKYCVMCSNLTAMLVFYAVVAIVYALSYVITYFIHLAEDKIDWDENPIPEFIYDVREVDLKQTSSNDGIETEYVKMPTFVPYEVVRNSSGKAMDLNAFSHDELQWLALYVSHEPAGADAKPIKAEDLLVKYGDGETPEDYTPLCVFGEVVAKNLNSYDEDDKVNGVYLFYRQDSKAVVESGKTYYISDVYLQAGESPEHCIELLEMAGYTPINVNLSPSSEEWDLFGFEKMYSYIGYKTTTNKNNAIRDIRISYDAPASPFSYGGATYAECGTSVGVTLYASKFTSTGTPILAGGLMVANDRDDVPAGYEPVNLFSGGLAMNFNTYKGNPVTDAQAQYYLYFLPEVTFTEGESYLGGLLYAYAKPAELLPLLAIAPNLKNEVLDAITAEFGYPRADLERMDANTIGHLYACAMLKATMPYDGKGSSEGFIYYSTFNPYRAIYSIRATQVGNTPASLSLESLGHTVVSTLEFVPRVLMLVAAGPWWSVNAGEEIALNTTLYITGNHASNVYDDEKKEMTQVQPIKISDLIIAGEKTGEELIPDEKSGYIPVTDIFDSQSDRLLIKNEEASGGYYFYLRDTAAEDKTYVSNIFATDVASLYRLYGGSDAGVSREMISRGVAYSALAGQGATNFCSHNTVLYGWVNGADVKREWEVNRLYYAFSKSDEASKGLTDLFLYYDGITNDPPPETLYKGSVKYSLLTEISAYNFSGEESSIVPRVYLYGTTNKKAGDRIIDFTVSSSPFKEGYETVRTQNGGSLWTEILETLKAEKEKQPHYVGRNLISEWIDFFTIRDDEDHGRWNSGIYLHYKREGGTKEELRPYIGEIYVKKADGENLNAFREWLFAMGADGYVKKDLNDGTIGDYIYIGYKRTGNPYDAIRDIRASHSKSHPESKVDSGGITYQLASSVDLNAGCGPWSDYIYLYYSKNVYAGDPISEISTSSKIQNGNVTEENEEGLNVVTGTQSTVLKWNSKSASDFNEDAGGDYIYLVMFRMTSFPDKGPFEEIDYGKNKTYTRKGANGEAEGKYIAALYVMDKNTLRQEKLALGEVAKDCECRDIPDSAVVKRLFEMGATTVIETPLLTRGEQYSGYDSKNANKIFIGYSRTDNLRSAIKGIVLNVIPLTAHQPEETIYVDKKSYKLVAEAATKVEKLPEAINLIGLEDAQDALSARVYLYTTTSGTEPIYDISIDTSPIRNDWKTVLSQNGKEAFADLGDQIGEFRDLLREERENPYTNANFSASDMDGWLEVTQKLFDSEKRQASSWYIHTKNYESDTLIEERPYIGDIFIAQGNTRQEALIRLLENDPDGFWDVNLNEGAGGRYIYMGYKRVDGNSKAEKPITDIVLFKNSTPYATQRVSIGNGNHVRYTLAENLNLNEGAGGSKLYLYTTTDHLAGEPIREIRIEKDHPIAGAEQELALFATQDGHSDKAASFNDGTEGRPIFLVFGQKTPLIQEPITLASLFGSGSAIALIALSGIVAVGVTGVILYKKKRRTAQSKCAKND